MELDIFLCSPNLMKSGKGLLLPETQNLIVLMGLVKHNSYRNFLTENHITEIHMFSFR